MTVAEPPGQHDRHWWAHGLLSAASGYFFAILISATLVVLAVAGAQPVIDLERVGVDLSMRIYTNLPTLLGNLDRRARPGGYVFIDVDRPACLAFTAGDAAPCDTRKPVPASLLAALAAALNRTAASVAIIDVAPPDQQNERRTYLDALLQQDLGKPGPWLVLPIEGRSGAERSGLRYEATAQLIEGLAEKRVRLASVSSFSDPFAGDGVLRHFPEAVVGFETGTSTLRWIVSAPFLAAALASGGQNLHAADCAFYQASDCTEAERSIALANVRYHFTALGEPDGADETIDRIFFSLPPATVADESATQAASALKDAYRGVMDSYSLSAFEQGGGRIGFPAGLLDGKTVVVGTSNPAAGDLHPTPLGVMPGGLVLLNATRSFAEFAPLKQAMRSGDVLGQLELGKERLAEKMLGASIVAVPLILGWLLISYALHRSSGSHPVRRGFVRLGCGCVFLFCLIIGLLCELGLAANSLRAASHAGTAVDLVSPALALGLEGYAETAVAVLGLLEALILAGVTGFGGIVRRGTRRVAALKQATTGREEP